MSGNQPNLKKLKFAKSTDASIGFCPCCKTTLEDHDHVLRCPAQRRTRYLALQDIHGTISETRSPAGPILWEGLTHWLSNPSEPLSIDTSRYPGRTKLLVQQALDEQERIVLVKPFRGYLSLRWGLLEVPHEVSNPYNKTPQPNAWVISTLANLGMFSKAMWTNRNKKLQDPTNTSSPTSDLDADIANYFANPQDFLAADRQLFNRPILKVLSFRRSYKTKWIRSTRHKSAAYHTPFLRPISSYSRSHCSSHSCIISCTPKSYAGPALVNTDPARVE
jgi:hypothetical protein